MSLVVADDFQWYLGSYQESIDRTFFNVKIVYGFQLLTTQKMKFSIKESSLRIWSDLLKKSLMEKLHFLCGVNCFYKEVPS